MIKVTTSGATSVVKIGTTHTTDTNEMITMKRKIHKKIPTQNQAGLQGMTSPTRNIDKKRRKNNWNPLFQEET